MSKVVKSSEIKVGGPIEIAHRKIGQVIPKNNQNVQPKNEEPEVSKESIDELALKQHDKIISNANSEAKKIIENAKKEAEKLKKQIYNTSREEGYNKGYYEISEKAEELLKEAESIKDNAQKHYNELIRSSEKDIIELVLSISRKVIGDELKSRKDVVVSLTKNILKEYNDVELVTIKVSEDDYSCINENIQKIKDDSSYSGEITIRKDPQVEKGTCILESESGIEDGSVNEKLKNIEELIFSICKNK